MTSSTTRAFMAKKQSTSFAQVATNLLNVLQGYSKTIRLLLVMFLTLTVSANVWGAEKTETISWNTYTTSGSGATLTITWTANTSCTITQAKGDNTSNNVSTSYATSPRWYQYHHITFTPKTGYTIKKVVLTGSSSSYHGQDMTFVEGSGTISKSGNATTITGAWTSSFKIKMGKQFRPGSVVVTYEEAAATVPVTGVSLNKSSLTLTEGDSETLTATVLPNNATDKTITWSTSNSSVATVSDGKVTAVAEGSATITVTTTDGGKTATCDVTVNPKPKYTVTWDVNGDQSVTTQVTEGSKPTFPATPSSCDATSTTFYGWATATWDGKIDNISEKTIYTSANNMPAVNGAVTYYAVFATKGAGGGTAFDGTSGGNFKIYALVEGVKKYLSGTGSKISPVDEAQATEYTFTKDGSVFYIQTGTTYLTYASSTNLGTSTDPYGWNISEGTKGSWRIASAANSSRGIVYRASTYNQFGGYSTSNITADGTEYYDVEIGGGSSVSYSGYITSCTTQTSRCVTPKMRG